MYYFVVVLFILLSVMSTVNVACSYQTHFVYVWDKRYIYLYTLLYVTKFILKFNGIKIVLAVTYHSYYLAHILLKGYSSQKSIDFLLNHFCIKLVTIHFSTCNFAIVYLYKEIKFKPRDPIASRVGFVPVFLKKPIATVIFQGGGSGRPVSPLIWILWIACFRTVTSTCRRCLICIPFCKYMTAKVGAYK